MKKTMMLVITICMSLSLFGCFDEDGSSINNTQVNQEQASNGQTSNDQTSNDQTSNDQTSSNQTSSNQTSNNQASNDQTDKEQASNEQSNIGLATGTPAVNEIVDDENFGDTVNKFAYKTSSKFINDSDNNCNYSPISLYYALAVATDGSKGDTQKELLNLLGVSSTDKLSSRCKQLYLDLNEDSKESKIKIANSMWISKDFTSVYDKFKNNAKDNYFAPVYDDMDFRSGTDLLRMTKWVSYNTNNTLNPDFTDMNEAEMAIINTIYFYNEWVGEFDQNLLSRGTFHANSKDEDVTFMSKTDKSSSYAKGEGFTRSSLSFKDGCSMVFILPDEGVKTTDLLSTAEKSKEIFEGGTKDYANVKWEVPKFGFDCSFNMVDELKKLNLNLPFSEKDADFTNISKESLYISKIRQDTHINIDVKGVEASGFTVVEMCKGAYSDPEEEVKVVNMKLDRPFIYGIKDKNGTLLFTGVCNNLAK